MSDAYLRQVLSLHAADCGPYSPARQAQAVLEPAIRRWGGGAVVSVEPSGSFAKYTAVRSGTDIDLFISLTSSTTQSLGEIFESLFRAMAEIGLQPKRQNVSIKVRWSNYDVDLVPARRQSQFGADHSLYSHRNSTWLKTNVATHIAAVKGSGRLDEIRILKIWRNQRGLDFPSFLLELATLRALYGKPATTLSANVVTALEFLRDHVRTVSIMDPANTNNVVSDTLTLVEKTAIAAAAANTLDGSWEQAVR